MRTVWEVYAVKDEEVKCWACGVVLRREMERRRRECLSCFAEKDGPYGDDDREDEDTACD
jgi:hypothetical protein